MPTFAFLFFEYHDFFNLRKKDPSMKQGNFFVLFVLMKCTEQGCFRLCSWSLLKALKEEGCISLVSWHLD